jgi:hypothetical protein
MVFLKEAVLAGIDMRDERDNGLIPYMVWLYIPNFYLLDKDDETYAYYEWIDSDREYVLCEPPEGHKYSPLYYKLKDKGWTGPTD